MSSRPYVTVTIMLIEALMKAGGYKELHIDELRRAITMVGQYAKLRVDKHMDLRYRPYKFGGEDIYDFISMVVGGWTRYGLATTYRIEVDSYRAGGEAVLIKSERVIEEMMKKALKGQEKSERDLLSPLVHQAYTNYKQSVIQNHGGDFY
ncbi:MAG: hypothetical protein ACYCY6_00320 [Minisyncoccota bacterium]